MAKVKSRNTSVASTHRGGSLSRYGHAHWLAFKTGFHNIAVTPISTLITITTIGVCLILPLSFYLVIKNIYEISQGWDQGAAITLYIESNASQEAIDNISQHLKTLSFVEKVNYLNPAQALAEFKTFSHFSDMLDLLPENPLPGMLSAQLDTKKTSETELLGLKQTLEKMPKVTQVVLDYQWAEKFKMITSFSNTLTHVFYFIIGLGVILMVGNTIRLALERHREEIEVLNLVGATSSFIRRPFLYRGILYGGLGGLIALLMLSFTAAFIKEPIQELTKHYEGLFTLRLLESRDVFYLLIFSGSLGWLGAAVAFTQQQHTFLQQN